MVDVLTPDICVIGAGSGGLSVAAAAAAFGVSVVLIEKGRMGGDCLNTGCVPSKSLIAAGKRARSVAEARAFGVQAAPPDIDFALVHKHVHDVIAAIAPNDSKERFTGLGVRVIEGTARFKDPDTVAVGDAIEIKARRFVIATGSSPAVPPIPGLDTTPHLTNETVFDLTARPEHLIVIGAGPIGLELAQAFRRLGSEVTVLEAAEPLGARGPGMRGCRARPARARGHHAAHVHGRRPGRGGRRRQSSDRRARRRAGGDDRRQPSAGRDRPARERRRPRSRTRRHKIRPRRHRGRQADSRPPTSASTPSATSRAGRNSPTLANYHAGLVIRNALFRLPTKVNEDAIPRVTFTDPELAHVGLTEAEAAPAHHHPGAALALSRERPRPGRARDDRPHQGHHRPGGAGFSAPPSSGQAPGN